MPAAAKPAAKRARKQEQPKNLLQLPSFDMSAKPCIPVAMIGENRPRLLSIGEALRQAKDIAAVSCPSPSTFLGVMRTLLCVTQRIAAPRTQEERAALIRDGVNVDDLAAYLKKAVKGGWFDLFHPERPFFQIQSSTLLDLSSDVSLEVANEQSVAKLTFVKAAGATKGWFDKSFDDNPTPMSSAAVGIELLGFQSCGMGGSNGGATDTSKPQASRITFANAPCSSGGVTFLLVGKNLAETLALNALTPKYAKQVVSDAAKGQDLPSWEDPPTGRAVLDELHAGFRGPLDFLSVVNKRVSLRAKTNEQGAPSLDNEGHALIVRCVARQGRHGVANKKKFVGSQVLNPMFAYMMRKEWASPINRTGYEHEPTWVTALRGLAADRRPLAVEQAAEFGYEGGEIRLRLAGVFHEGGVKSSSVSFMENDEVTLPATLLDHALAKKMLEVLTKAVWGVTMSINDMNWIIDYSSDKHPNKKKIARDRARTDEGVTHFWHLVRDHALYGAAMGLLDDKDWSHRLRQIVLEAKQYNARRRGIAPETIMGVAEALA